MMDEGKWNRIMNEGGEGYNPCRQDTQGNDEPAWSKIDDQLAKTQRIINCTSLASPELPRLQAQCAALEAALEAALAGTGLSD